MEITSEEHCVALEVRLDEVVPELIRVAQTRSPAQDFAQLNHQYPELIPVLLRIGANE